MSAIAPTTLRPGFSRVLPLEPGRYHGPALALWATVAYLVVVTGRSLVHLFAADGGAHSIATIDTSVAGGSNIIVVRSVGCHSTLAARLLWVLLLRYRGFLPLVILTLLIEPLLREVSGALKPIETVGVAPGSALNVWAIPVLSVLFYLALCPAEGSRP